jgi:hypothetical protein
MRGVDGSAYGKLFKKYLEEDGVVCIFFLSFFLLIGAKLIFFLSNIDSPYQWYGRYAELTTLRITDAGSWRLSVSVMRGVDSSAYMVSVSKVFRRGRGCLHILGDRNESTNVSISKLIIRTKPKRFDLVRLLPEQKQNVSICSKII